jgi:hypothetical protein
MQWVPVAQLTRAERQVHENKNLDSNTTAGLDNAVENSAGEKNIDVINQENEITEIDTDPLTINEANEDSLPPAKRAKLDESETNDSVLKTSQMDNFPFMLPQDDPTLLDSFAF